jgi:hypothetical protein
LPVSFGTSEPRLRVSLDQPLAVSPQIALHAGRILQIGMNLFWSKLCIFSFKTNIENFIEAACFTLTAYFGPLRLPSQAVLQAARAKNAALYLLLLSYWIHEMDADSSGVDETIKRLDGVILDDASRWRDRITDQAQVEVDLQDGATLLRQMYDALAGRWENWRAEKCTH